jgi:hypothetical protein
VVNPRGPDAMHKNDVHRTKIEPARCSFSAIPPRSGRVFVRLPDRTVPVAGCPLLDRDRPFLLVIRAGISDKTCPKLAFSAPTYPKAEFLLFSI